MQQVQISKKLTFKDVQSTELIKDNDILHTNENDAEISDLLIKHESMYFL